MIQRLVQVDDSDARYLIDQYNKYASWDVTSWQIMLPYIAVIIAAMALLAYSLPRNDWIWLVNQLVYIAVLIIGGRVMNEDRKKRSGHKDLLLRLEDHRSKAYARLPRGKALPDELTLELLINEPEQVKKLLDASGRSPVYGPQV